MKRQTISIGIIFSVMLICVLSIGAIVGVGIAFYKFEQTSNQSLPQTHVFQPLPTATPTIAPKIKPDQAPISPPTAPAPALSETEGLLIETKIPIRDLRQLASRLKYDGQDLSVVVNSTPPTYVLGDQDTFWILDNSNTPPKQFEVMATLQYITDHTYWWVENGFHLDAEDVRRSAEVFETKTYPTTRSFFGSEWSPGVDNDVHISIFLGNVPGVGGYYASSHEFSQEVDPYSNEREMFFINLNALKPGNNTFDGVLAHEFQHMIHWHQDRNEQTWVNEGFSELAVLLNGFTLDRAQEAYLQQPDLQLTTWGYIPSASIPHYGSSYLFMTYFLDRFGEEVVKAVVANPGDGVQGFNNVLQKLDPSKSFDDVFADFIIANYLNDPTLADGRWGYKNLAIQPAAIDTHYRAFPIDRTTTVHQYGVDYIELSSDQPLAINFTGSPTVSVLSNQAYSGRYQWYSNRGDDSDATLTRMIDLSNVRSATLNYWVWYDLEEDWDYAYVQISTNNGQSWTILEAPHSRTTNPTGNAYGPGYTGNSAGWVEESVDLSSFAGQEILLRFEYITDDATNGPGFALDDVSIPEINFHDDMETTDPAWHAEGFIRMDNLLRQGYIVQVINLSNPPAVTRIPLDEANRGTLTIGDTGAGVRAILVVSAQAPVTTEVAAYTYTVAVVE